MMKLPIDTLTEQEKSSILFQIKQIDNRYRDSSPIWFQLVLSADRASTYVSSEYVTHHLESTSEKVTVTSSHCDIAYGNQEADTVLVAHLPGFDGIFVLKRYGSTLIPWNGTDFDKTRTILRTVHKEPPLMLADRLRKRSMVSQLETEDPVKRRRPSNRPMTPGSEDSEESREEGSIYHDRPGDGVRASALLPTSSPHTAAAVRPRAADVDTHPINAMGRPNAAPCGVTGWQREAYVPMSPSEARGHIMRGFISAWTARSEEPLAKVNHSGGKKRASTNTASDPADEMPQAPPSNTVKITTAFKQAHTTFVFVHRDTGQRSPRAFYLCDSLHKLFRRAQIACTIAPGTSDGALAVNVNGTMKNVAQQDGEDDYREMLEAIWQSAFWTSEDENVMCEVRVRELVLV